MQAGIVITTSNKRKRAILGMKTLIGVKATYTDISKRFQPDYSSATPLPPQLSVKRIRDLL